ncbi:MAG: GNAT family N-acetyltransferase [Rhizobiaceae bacterium]
MRVDSRYLRSVTRADSDLIFNWRNLPEIVALGASGRSVSWEEHEAWFARAVADHDGLLFLILRDGEPVGQLRFDPSGDGSAGGPSVAVITIYLVGDHSGQGLGSLALQRGCALAQEKWPGMQIFEARVLPTNAKAVRFFTANGFSEESPLNDTGTDLRVFRLMPDKVEDL